MQAVADALGLHRRTVSAVVNGTARERRISAATVERVEQYLAAVGYVPSRQAQELREGGAVAKKVGILFGALSIHTRRRPSAS